MLKQRFKSGLIFKSMSPRVKTQAINTKDTKQEFIPHIDDQKNRFDQVFDDQDYLEAKLNAKIDKTRNEYDLEIKNIRQFVNFRLQKLDYLVSFLMNTLKHSHSERQVETKKALQMANQLKISLINASKNEVDLSASKRNILVNSLKNEITSHYLQKNRVMLMQRNKQLEQLRIKNKNLEQRVNRLNIQLTTSKNIIAKKAAIIKKLQKRIRIIENPEKVQGPKEHIRATLFQLIKQNDRIKKDDVQKKKRISKLKDQIMQVRASSVLIQAKIQCKYQQIAIKLRKGIVLDKQQQQRPQVDFSSQNLILSYNLNFRTPYSGKYAQLIGRLIQMGSQNFVNKMFSLYGQQRFKQITKFFIQLFLAAKQFESDLNTLFIEIFQYGKILDLPLIMKRINGQGPQLFKVERCYLWALDKLTGILYTYNYNAVQIRATHSSGLFRQLFEKGGMVKYFDKQPVIVCEQIGKQQPIISYGCLLMPLKNEDGDIIVFLQVSQSEPITIQMQYYSLIIIKYIKFLLNNRAQYDKLKLELRHSNQYFQYFKYISTSSTKLQFVQRVKQVVNKIFQIKQFDIVFIVNHKFLKYKQTQKMFYPQTLGITGLAASCKHHILLTDSINHQAFDSQIDLYAVRPVHYYPITQANESNILEQDLRVHGVIQVVQKIKKEQSMQIFKNNLMQNEKKGYNLNFQKMLQIITITIRSRQMDKQ